MCIYGQTQKNAQGEKLLFFLESLILQGIFQLAQYEYRIAVFAPSGK